MSVRTKRGIIGAIRFVSAESGRQFDERCVAALERVLRREQPELAVAV